VWEWLGQINVRLPLKQQIKLRKNKKKYGVKKPIN